MIAVTLTLALALAALAQDAPRADAATGAGTDADASAPAEERGVLKRTDAATPGYLLIAPLRSELTYLLDGDGETVHTWKGDGAPGNSVYLLDDGHLLRCERVPSDVFSGGGQGGRVREYDWDGNQVWEYVCADEGRLHHHDVEPLPNGNVLVIAWERKTREQALAAGRDPDLLPAGELWPDMVLEIEPVRPSGGKIVWEWHAWDHLVQDRDPGLPHHGEVAQRPERIDVDISTREPEPPADGAPPAGGAADDDAAALEDEELARLRGLGYLGDGTDDDAQADDDGRDRNERDDLRRRKRGADWLHCNAIDYHPELDLVVLSSRELSEIWFIDHSTTTEEARGSTGGRWGRGGDLLLRWGNPRWSGQDGERTLFGQHDAQWIPEGYPGAGNVILFNNGERELRERSTADELAIPFDPAHPRRAVPVTLVASYPSPDFSGHISGVQRLWSGNTLICAGESGRVVEMTPEHEIVWEYLNDRGGDVVPDERRGGPPPDRGGPGNGGRPGDGRPGGGPGGRGPGGRGPGEPFALFRATLIPLDHPGLARLAR